MSLIRKTTQTVARHRHPGGRTVVFGHSVGEGTGRTCGALDKSGFQVDNDTGTGTDVRGAACCGCRAEQNSLPRLLRRRVAPQSCVRGLFGNLLHLLRGCTVYPCLSREPFASLPAAISGRQRHGGHCCWSGFALQRFALQLRRWLRGKTTSVSPNCR